MVTSAMQDLITIVNTSLYHSSYAINIEPRYTTLYTMLNVIYIIYVKLLTV